MNSLKVFLVLTCICILPAYSAAQINKGGITFGVNASQVHGDGAYGYDQFGIYFGGFVDFHLTGGLAFSPSIVFEQLGSKRATFGELILRTNYFSFPILLKLDPAFRDNPFLDKFSLEGGLVPGVLLSAKDNFSPLGNELTRYDLRMIYGINYSEMRFGYYFRLGQSLSKFVQTDPFIFRNLTNIHVYVTLGVEFYFSRN